MDVLRKGFGLLCTMIGASMITSYFMWEGLLNFVERSFSGGQENLLFISTYHGLVVFAGAACIATLASKFPTWISMILAIYGVCLVFAGIIFIFEPGFVAAEYPKQFENYKLSFAVGGAGAIITGAWLCGILKSRDWKKSPA